MTTKRYAKVECCSCHVIIPKNEACSRKERVETGQSGMSVSYRPRAPRSKREGWVVHSGRRYTREKTFWYCRDCWQHRAISSEHAGGAVVMVLFAMVILIGIILS